MLAILIGLLVQPVLANNWLAKQVELNIWSGGIAHPWRIVSMSVTGQDENDNYQYFTYTCPDYGDYASDKCPYTLATTGKKWTGTVTISFQVRPTGTFGVTPTPIDNSCSVDASNVLGLGTVRMNFNSNTKTCDKQWY